MTGRITEYMRMGSHVTDRNGVRGTLDLNVASVQGGKGKVMVRFRETASVFIPTNSLVSLEDGTYFLPESLDELWLRGREKPAEAPDGGCPQAKRNYLTERTENNHG